MERRERKCGCGCNGRPRMARAARPSSSGGGRPSKRTPEIKARVIAGIKAGLTLKLACERVSITTVTLHS